VPVGTTLEDAEEILHEHRVEKLLVVDDNTTSRTHHRKRHSEETEVSNAAKILRDACA